MRTIVITSLLSTLVACFVGCESPGRFLAKSVVDQIRDGMTTRTEIVKLFGEPKETKSPEGKTLYLPRPLLRAERAVISF